MKAMRLWGFLLWAVILAVVVVAFLKVGSPGVARNEREDEERVADLESLVRAVRAHYSDKKELPQDLSLVYAIADKTEDDLRDPETLEPYRYRAVDATHFELCATFATDQSRQRDRRWPGGEDSAPFWKHEAGYQCFVLPAKTPKL